MSDLPPPNDPSRRSEASDNLDEQPLLITPDLLAESPRMTRQSDRRIEFERKMSYCPRLILMLLGANVFIFIWQVMTGALSSSAAIIEAGALERAHLLQGEVWRLLSATFLHGSFDHLLGNCLVLYILGIACEHALGSRQVLVVYLISALSGSLLSVALQSGPSVGASGAIFGLMGSAIVFLYRYQKFFVIRDQRLGFVLIMWGLYAIASGFLTPYVDNFAHIGGFVGGSVATLFQKPFLLRKWKLV